MIFAGACEGECFLVSKQDDKKREMERAGRKWVLDNFSVSVIGKKIEDFIDNAPFVESFNFSPEEQDPYAKIEDQLSNTEWIKSLYAKILKRSEVDEKDDGYKYWMNEISKGMTRQHIEAYFRQVAAQDNQKNNKTTFEDLLDKNDEGKRILYVIPESIGDIYISTAVFESIKKQYPDHNLYVAVKPEYKDILNANPYVHRVLDYIPQMDQLLWLEGMGDHKGFFEIAFLPHIGTQKIFNYQHNGKTNIAYDLNL